MASNSPTPTTPITSFHMLHQYPSEEFTDLMVDCETMGNGAKACPIAIGAVPFSRETGETGVPFRVHIDFADALGHGLTITPSTVAFWMEHAEKWLELQNDEYTSPLPDALLWFSHYVSQLCSDDVRVWAKGADFEFGLVLRPAFDAVNLDLPWDFRNHRCLRTLEVDVPKSEDVHDPVFDAIAQTKAVVQAFGSPHLHVDGEEVYA